MQRTKLRVRLDEACDSRMIEPEYLGDPTSRRSAINGNAGDRSGVLFQAVLGEDKLYADLRGKLGITIEKALHGLEIRPHFYGERTHRHFLFPLIQSRLRCPEGIPKDRTFWPHGVPLFLQHF